MARRVTVLFGSQTGNAEAIAKLVGADLAASRALRDAGWVVEVTSMLGFVRARGEVAALASERVVVLVCSTTGSGDPPENAAKFWRQLNQLQDAQILAGLRVAVLGLGDSNYSNFCQMGKRLEEKLPKLGAARMLDTAFADDAVGLDAVVEPWRKRLVPAVEAAVRELEASGSPAAPLAKEEAAAAAAAASAALATVAAVAQQEEKEKEDADEGDSNVPAALLEPGRLELHWLAGDAASACASERAQDRWRAARIETELKGYTAEAPFLGRLAAARFLTRVGAEKHVLHLEVEPPRSGSEQVLFNPGDSLGVFCPNDEEVVAALLRRLRVTEPDRRFEFRRTSSGLSDEARARHRAQRRQQVLARRRERGAREGEGADRPEAPPPPLPSPPAPVSTAAPPIEAKAAFGERVMVGHVAEATTPREALLFFFDLSSPPRKALLRVLAEHCSDEKEREALLRLCSHQGTEEYERKIVEPRLTLLEVLAAHPSSAPPLARVLEHLGPAQPRYYSVSASPFASQSRIQLALTVVDVERGGRRVLGLCSTWLYRLACFAGLIAPADDAYAQGCALRGLTPPAPPSAGRLPAGCCADPRGGVCVPMFLRRARDFALPEDARRPLVLVGPGTGVAPFRAFLQHRDAQRRALAEGGESVGFWRGLEVVEDSASEHSRRGSPPTAAAMGHVLLFFGCRDPELDFLYRQDLEELCAAGRGATLVTAFSRQPGQPRVYVQDRLREHGKIVARLLLEENAAVFVCGDGAAMAKDLARAVQEVLAQHGGPSAADAEGLLARLVREHRYVQEIWS